MSIEMQDVIAKDNGILRENNEVEFIGDTEAAPTDIPKQQDEPVEAETVTMDEL